MRLDPLDHPAGSRVPHVDHPVVAAAGEHALIRRQLDAAGMPTVHWGTFCRPGGAFPQVKAKHPTGTRATVKEANNPGGLVKLIDNSDHHNGMADAKEKKESSNLTRSK